MISQLWRQEAQLLIKVSTGLDPSGESIPFLSPSFWWLLAILGFLWFADT